MHQPLIGHCPEADKVCPACGQQVLVAGVWKQEAVQVNIGANQDALVFKIELEFPDLSLCRSCASEALFKYAMNIKPSRKLNGPPKIKKTYVLELDGPLTPGTMLYEDPERPGVLTSENPANAKKIGEMLAETDKGGFGDLIRKLNQAQVQTQRSEMPDALKAVDKNG